MPARSRLLSEILGIEKREITSIMGSGGKTTLLYLIAGELGRRGWKLVLTTTTHLGMPEAVPTVIEEDEDRLFKRVRETLKGSPFVLAARSSSPGGKLNGIEAGSVAGFLDLEEVDAVLVEADGARMKPLKGHAPHEPVIPPSSSRILVVAGLDCVGRPLSEEHVHRPEIAADLLGMKMGEIIAPESVARLIVDPGGYLERAVPGKVAVVLNKVDGFMELQWAMEISQRIVSDPRISQVVLRGEYLSGGIWDLGKGA
jgi:molybdenum cofactor cytidylyltransferase